MLLLTTIITLPICFVQESISIDRIFYGGRVVNVDIISTFKPMIVTDNENYLANSSQFHDIGSF